MMFYVYCFYINTIFFRFFLQFSQIKNHWYTNGFLKWPELISKYNFLDFLKIIFSWKVVNCIFFSYKANKKPTPLQQIDIVLY